MKLLKHLKKLRYVLVLLFLIPSLQLLAQSNVREGYVITLQGDTLYGEIDFRTSAMNMKRCVFRKKGETSFKTYLPGEISGYRFTTNGIYYVSKEVETDEGKEVVFVEYVLHGNMNLYQLGSDDMLLEDEDGNLAKFSVVKAQRSTDKKEVRNEMKDVLIMLNKSPNATHLILEKDKNRENTKKAVKAYVEEVCPDGFCESFEYKSKKTPKEDRTMYYWVKAGLKYTAYKFHYNGEIISGVSPQFSAGLDFHINRLFKGLMVNVGIAFELGKTSQDLPDVYKDNKPHTYLHFFEKTSNVDFQQLDVMLGPGYQFKIGSLMLRAKCGGIYRLASKNFNFTNSRYSYDSNVGGFKKNKVKEAYDISYGFNVQFGLYAGAGIEYPLNGFSIICDLDYIYDYNKWDFYGLEERTIVKQNGICLSAGVKF